MQAIRSQSQAPLRLLFFVILGGVVTLCAFGFIAVRCLAHAVPAAEPAEVPELAEATTPSPPEPTPRVAEALPAAAPRSHARAYGHLQTAAKKASHHDQVSSVGLSIEDCKDSKDPLCGI